MSFDSIGFPLRGLPPDSQAERLASWVRWPIDRGTARELVWKGRKLRVHALAVGEGARLVTVVEVKKRVFLPGEEIVCFYPDFAAGAERTAQLAAVESGACPLEPWGVTGFPERIRFRIGEPFEESPEPGARISVSLALLASRVEPAPDAVRAGSLPTSIAVQDPEVPPEHFTVSGTVESAGSFRNEQTGEECRRFRVTTPAGALDVVARARDAAGVKTGDVAVAEGEFVGRMRAG